jgi:AcrR family transcriptional regulator
MTPARQDDRTTRHRTASADVRRLIVEAAVHVLDEDGPEALTVRGVAERAGVSPTGVYNHLGGKDGVLAALFAMGFDELHDAIEGIDLADPLEAFSESGRRYRATALRHPGRYSLMFERSGRGWTPSVEDFTHAAAAFVALERRVVACQLAGLFREGPPTGLAQLVWSTVHGQVSLELRGMLFVPDPDASFEELLELIAAGISA